MMAVRDLDEHATADDVGVELFQPANTLANLGLEQFGMRKSSEGDLGRNECHGNVLMRRDGRVTRLTVVDAVFAPGIRKAQGF